MINELEDLPEPSSVSNASHSHCRLTFSFAPFYWHTWNT